MQNIEKAINQAETTVSTVEKGINAVEKEIPIVQKVVSGFTNILSTLFAKNGVSNTLFVVIIAVFYLAPMIPLPMFAVTAIIGIAINAAANTWHGRITTLTETVEKLRTILVKNAIDPDTGKAMGAK